MREFVVATDGSCRGNPGPGGWAAVVRSGNRRVELAGGERRTTNNRMELTAAIEALRQIGPTPARVTITTDSEYLRNGITRWVAGWRRKGWRTATGEPVKNRELWEELIRLTAPHSVHWAWTRGHIGHPDNERCDELARCLTERAAAGTLPPEPIVRVYAEPDPVPAGALDSDADVEAPAVPSPVAGVAVDAAPRSPGDPTASACRFEVVPPPPAAAHAGRSLGLTQLAFGVPPLGEPGEAAGKPEPEAALPTPAVARAALLDWVEKAVTCERDGAVLRLRTPFVLPDGNAFEVWLSEAPCGLAVSDGGYAAEQVELAAREATDPAAAVLPPIADRLGLVWDDRTGVLGYVEPTLEAAVCRLPQLARAVAAALLAPVDRAADA